MDKYEYIRTAHRVYGEGIKELSRKTGHSRNTIRRVLREEYREYPRRQVQSHPKLGAYHEVIDGWLEGDRTEPKKQRHTAHRVYERLVAEYGYEGCESNVRRYVRDAKLRLGLKGTGAFLPLEPECGQEAEVDWGTATVELNGERVRVKFFCMRSRYSGKYFVRCYRNEKQQSFLDAHMRAFHFFGGVFPVVIYDNLSSAVKKVYPGRKRDEQASFVRFRSYYNYEARFCNVGQGHEKGGVENLVGYVRRNHLVPVPRVTDLASLNQTLLTACEAYGRRQIEGHSQRVEEQFIREKAHLIPLPPAPYRNVVEVQGRVNRYSTVRVEKNRYSVPVGFLGRQVRIELSVERIGIFYQGKRIAEHDRAYGKNEWCLDLDHYLELLRERPMAFDTARPVRQKRSSWPKSFEELLTRFRALHGYARGNKEFVSVLLCYRMYSAESIHAAVEKAIADQVETSDGVKHFLALSKEEATPSPLEAWPSTPPVDISNYSQLEVRS